MEVLNLIIKFVFGIVLATLGGLLLWHTWRRKRGTLNLQGEIVGVHEEQDKQGPLFRPVIAYIDANGQKKKMLSDTAVRSISRVEIGATRSIAVDPSDPLRNANVGTFWVYGVIGVVLVAIGITIAYFAVTEMTLTLTTLGQIGIVMAFLAVGLTPLWQMIRFGMNPDINAALRTDRRENLSEELEESEELDANELAARIRSEDQDRERQKDRAALVAYPIRIVMGVAILVAGGSWSYGELKFLARATATAGTVVRNDHSTNRPRNLALPISGYAAIIEFRTTSGANQTLRDWLALKQPQFESGDRVPVLYDETNPARAVPDRGLWNWSPPIALLILGIFLVLHPFIKLVARFRR
jgi:hypothetical protein